jgi:hypothetical protein
MFTITNDRTNKDIPEGMSIEEARQHYLNMHGSFVSKLPRPDTLMQPYGDKWILRCDLSPAGFKSFAAEKMISEIEEDTLVYCAPRVGHAPEAICVLAEMYGKDVVFFAPASKEVSNHQAVLTTYGADMRFIKIAAMPTLNVYAKRWAAERGAKYLPFGLSGVPQVTAGIVNLADSITRYYGEPSEFYCATSTGTMIRGLQIGWPNATPRSVAVARNIHDGEIGRADVRSATMPFLRPIKELPPFPTTATYDAKAWDLFDKEGKPGSVFINVGADQVLEARLGQVNKADIDSNRAWHDMRDYHK